MARAVATVCALFCYGMERGTGTYKEACKHFPKYPERWFCQVGELAFFTQDLCLGNYFGQLTKIWHFVPSME